MDFKDYLQKQKKFQLSALAELMWPGNTMAKSYLSAKLNGLDKRKWTDKDEKLAKKCLKKIGVSIIEDAKGGYKIEDEPTEN